MNPLLDDLNPEQRRAVETTDGPLLILAGAGSGKTRVLTRRIAYLLTKGVAPWEILAVTFTNKAAGEMKARVAALVGERANRILVSTFHASCMRFLRQDIERLGYSRSFTIYDQDDSTRLIKQVAEEAKVDLKKYPVPRLRAGIDRAKNLLLGPDQLAALGPMPGRAVDLLDPTPRVYERYQKALVAASAVDFNDLLNLVVRLWQEHPEVLRRYQDRYRYLLVDEYQDTNHAQYQLVKLLAGRLKNVAVVGDDDQSIYAFRGADVSNILNFQKDFPGAAVVRLERNYRSTGNILKVASAVVENNNKRMAKEMYTEAGDGPPVRVFAEESEPDEARRVLDEVRRLRQQGFSWGDIAIIYRTNAASRAFEQLFAREQVPHVLVGARKFYERREVKDVLAYVRLVLNPADDMAFLRAIGEPARGIGPKAIDAIRAEAVARGVPLLEGLALWTAGGGKSKASGMAFYTLIRRLADRALAEENPASLVRAAAEESGYAEALRREDSHEARGRLENLDELVRAVDAAVSGEEADLLAEEEEEGHPPNPLQRLQSFLDRVALAAGSDELPDEGGRITMLTAHLAKGLEFPVVFVTGLYEGGFPHFRSLEAEADIEEERRLVYVAFTRAERHLFLSRPRARMVFDSTGRPRLQATQPSRFLGEIQPGLLQFGASPGRSAPAPAPPRPWAPPQRPGAPAPRPGPPPPRAPNVLPFPGARARDAAPPPEPEEAARTWVPESLSAFAPGVRVMHKQLGRGVVVERQGSPTNPKLVIAFDQFGRRTVIALQAQLEILMS